MYVPNLTNSLTYTHIPAPLLPSYYIHLLALLYLVYSDSQKSNMKTFSSNASSFLWKSLPLFFILVLVMIPSSCTATAAAAATTTATGNQVDHADDPTTVIDIGLNGASFAAPATATTTATGNQVDHADDPTTVIHLGLNAASFSSLDDPSNFNIKEPTLRNDRPDDILKADINEGMEWNLKGPIRNDRFLALKASSTSRIVNPSSSFKGNVFDDIPCPCSCDSMCESHVNQFILHLVAITTLDKVQLKEEIAAVIQLQRPKQYVPEEDESRELESSPSLASLSSLEADSQSSTIPVKEEQEEVKGEEILSTVGEGYSHNSTTLILSPSFSRYQERRLVDVTTIAWSLVTSSASWSGGYGLSSVALDSNTIVLMGGETTGYSK